MPERPPHATHHCRHYSYRLTGLAGLRRGDPGGPCCARGVDMSAPGAAASCMPREADKALPFCASRQEYTDLERSAWQAFVAENMAALGRQIDALPPAQPCGSEVRVPCPECKIGEFVSQRMRNGHAWVQCTTGGCRAPTHFNIRRETEWPAPRKLTEEGTPA